MKCASIVAAFLAVLAAPVLADFRSVTLTQTGGDNANETMNMTVESFVKGDVGQFYIRKSSNEVMKEGMFFYTPDALKTLFLVNPEDKTFSEWDMEAFLQFALSVLKSLGPLVKFEIVDPKVELISQKPGPTRHGLDTEEYLFGSRYGIESRVLGIKQKQLIEETTKIRTATLPIALGLFMRTKPPLTGTEFDKIVENSPWGQLGDSEVALEYRLDTVVTSGKKGKKQKQQTSWQETRATELDLDSSGPADGYGFPGDYQEVVLMPNTDLMAADQGEGEGESQKEKKGWRRLIRKKDDG